jgi:hypothetical protein
MYPAAMEVMHPETLSRAEQITLQHPNQRQRLPTVLRGIQLHASGSRSGQVRYAAVRLAAWASCSRQADRPSER